MFLCKQKEPFRVLNFVWWTVLEDVRTLIRNSDPETIAVISNINKITEMMKDGKTDEEAI